MNVYSMGTVGVEQEHYPEYIDKPPMHPVNIAAVLSQMGPITCTHIVDILMRDFPDAPEEDLHFDGLRQILERGYYSSMEGGVHYNMNIRSIQPIMEDHELTLYYLQHYSEQEAVRFDIPDLNGHFFHSTPMEYDGDPTGIRIEAPTSPFVLGGEHRMDASVFRVEPTDYTLPRIVPRGVVPRGQRAIADGVDSVFDGEDWAPVEPTEELEEIDMEEVMRRAREITGMDDYTETYIRGAVLEATQPLVGRPMTEATFLEMRDTVHNTVHSVLEGTR